MVWIYEVVILETDEVVKVYSRHCIEVFKYLCGKFGFRYESWCGYLDKNCFRLSF